MNEQELIPLLLAEFHDKLDLHYAGFLFARWIISTQEIGSIAPLNRKAMTITGMKTHPDWVILPFHSAYWIASLRSQRRD